MRYHILGWADFFDQLKQVRILNLLGAMGTGKTLFSVALGYHMLKLGRVGNAAFNFPVAFGGRPFPLKTYCVLDEAGAAFGDRSTFRDKAKSLATANATVKLRKQGSYLVIPSFLGVDKRFRAGVRMWRVRTLLNDRLWLYSWEVGPEAKEERRVDVNYWAGRVLFFSPQSFYGTYDTYFFPPPPLTLDFLDQFIGKGATT